MAVQNGRSPAACCGSHPTRPAVRLYRGYGILAAALMIEVFLGITMDPSVRFGKPCVAGTRVDVATIVAAIAAGETVDSVAGDYQLTIEQVQAALAYDECPPVFTWMISLRPSALLKFHGPPLDHPCVS